MRKIKVAVIGVGHLGIRHAQIYQNLKNAQLVGICDINPRRLKEVCQQLKVKGYTSYRKLFPYVEAVSIAVPAQQHYEIAKDFLKQRIHVLVEKPFVLSLKDANNLIKLSQKNKLILQVGHIERFNPAFNATLKLIKDVRYIECDRLSPFSGRGLDVGVVMDLMIHDIDIIVGLVKAKLQRIEAIGTNVLTEKEDIANARLYFKNGCICNLTASRISEETVRKIRIFLKDAYISLDYRNREAFIYKKINSTIQKKAIPIEKKEPLKKEISSFLNCILYKRKPLVCAETAKEALIVALKIQRKIWRKNKF